MTQNTFDLEPVNPGEYQAGREFQRTGTMPMVSENELLRIGLAAGRAFIEQPKLARKRKDKLTMDLFGERNLF